jgi:polysaccharide biosynthesis transport protein
MGLQQFLILVLRGWWLILLAVLVTAGSTAFFVSRQTPEYRASTTVELLPLSALEARDVVNVYDLLDKRSISNTLARKAEGSAMAQQVANKLGIDVSVVTSANISAIVLPDSNIIEVSASSSSPDLAAAIGNTVAEEMLGQTPDKILEVEAIDRALPPGTPIAPQPTRMLILGLISGLVLGVIFVLVEHAVRGPIEPGGGVGSGGRREPAPLRGSTPAVGGAVNAVVEP